jgi:hypothetical protein
LIRCHPDVVRATWFSSTEIATFAESPALVDVAALVPAAALALASPILPVGEQLLQANLYAVCELIAGRASSARPTQATSICSAATVG